MIHQRLQDMIVEAIPQIEVVNRRDVREAGARHKELAREVKKELEEWDNERPKGLSETDNIIADAIEDPTFELDAIMEKFRMGDDDDEEEEKINKAIKKNELMTIKEKANKRITDKKINEFEKVQHMRIKMLNDDAEEPEDKGGFMSYAYQDDLNRF